MRCNIKPTQKNKAASFLQLKHTETQLEKDRLLRQASLHLMNACQFQTSLLCYHRNPGFNEANVATVGCIYPCSPHHWRQLPMIASLKCLNWTKTVQSQSGVSHSHAQMLHGLTKQHGFSMHCCQEAHWPVQQYCS